MLMQILFLNLGVMSAVNHAYVEGLEAEMKNVLLKYDLIAQQVCGIDFSCFYSSFG